jgi:hypothetical protein
MEIHCNSIVNDMADSEQFSITLPNDALEMIDNGLIPFGLYGKRRATICAELILAALRTPEVQANVRAFRQAAAGGDPAILRARAHGEGPVRSEGQHSDQLLLGAMAPADGNAERSHPVLLDSAVSGQTGT